MRRIPVTSASRPASTALLMDTGRPPPVALSQEAHAGCLSFELSWKQHRLVINCGLPAVNRQTWRQVARATAAHSTVTFNDTSSCQFLESGLFRRLLSGTPMVAGPRQVAVERDNTADGALLRTSHDGYARRLRRDSQPHRADYSRGRPRARRRGRFRAGRWPRLPGQHARRIRHPFPPSSGDQGQPAVGRPRRDPAAAGPRLWTFATPWPTRSDSRKASISAGTDGPRRAVQIVIYGHARKRAEGAMELPPHPAGTCRAPVRAGRTSRNCRCDGLWMRRADIAPPNTLLPA